MIVDLWLIGPKMANFADRERLEVIAPVLGNRKPTRLTEAAVVAACEQWWNLRAGSLAGYTVSRTGRSDDDVHEVLVLPPGRDASYGEQLISPRRISPGARR